MVLIDERLGGSGEVGGCEVEVGVDRIHAKRLARGRGDGAGALDRLRVSRTVRQGD